LLSGLLGYILVSVQKRKKKAPKGTLAFEKTPRRGNENKENYNLLYEN
jgi:hypothetical protein